MNSRMYWLGLILLGLASCNDSTFEEDKSEDIQYVILEQGKYIDYRYDTILYRGSNIDTFSGYFRHQLNGDFILQSGDTATLKEVYWKRELNMPWQRIGTEHERLSDQRYIVSDDGLNFIKLTFPVVIGNSWKGNSLFSTENPIIDSPNGQAVIVIPAGSNWSYRYISDTSTIDLGDIVLNNLLLVNQIDDEQIFKRLINEYYAENIGLVKKEMIMRDNQSDGAGYEMFLTMIDHN